MKYLSTLFSIFVAINFISAQKVSQNKASEWIIPITLHADDKSPSEGSSKYVLIDYQDNLALQERYTHFAIKILNSDGVQEFSDISINYDPTYQKLSVHAVNVIRNNQVINKLKDNQFNVLQRETNIERHLYDGSLTAVMNLTDVRAGDIIEYSYTITGFNPINNGNFSTSYYQQYTLPVTRIYGRLVNATNKSIQQEILNDAAQPKIVDSKWGKEYIWDSNGLERTLYENSVPDWYNPQKRVSVSTFENWSQVVDLIRPHYVADNITLPKEVSTGLENKEELLVATIRFVQDDVRYLGFESGIGAYKPNKPSTVLSRRFGDCKDKSLLLVSLLENQGISAYPFLVNTYLTKDLDRFPPGLNSFNHCIVNFQFEGQDYFIDPTISNQGGDLSTMSFPNYGKGLRLKRGEVGLLDMPTKRKSSIGIAENIKVDSIGGGASFEVETTYTGSRANSIRSYFNNNSEEYINTEYLNFYSELYPSIESTGKIEVLDNSRSSTNEVIVKEHYYINDFWSKSEENDALIYCETYPLVLESYLNYSNTANRKMPYYLGSPYEFKQVTTLQMPEPWSVTQNDFQLDEPSFSYKDHSYAVGNTVVVTHDYSLKKGFIEAETVGDFLEKHDQIFTQLSYQLTYLDAANNPSGLSWTAIILSILVFLIGIYCFWKLYTNYNPKPHETGQQLSIGGWLILPAIGLTLSPIIILVQVFQEDYFLASFWYGIQNSGIDNSWLLTLISGFELFYNIGFFLFTVLIITLFYTKRTSLPKLIILFYLLSFSVPLLETILLSAMYPDLFDATDPESVKDLTRAIVGAAIWIPYFLVSTRVKKTFSAVYK